MSFQRGQFHVFPGHIQTSIFSKPVINCELRGSKFFNIPIMALTEINRTGTLIIKSPPVINFCSGFLPILVGPNDGTCTSAVPFELIDFPGCFSCIMNGIFSGLCHVTNQRDDVILPFRIISVLFNTPGQKKNCRENQTYAQPVHLRKNLRSAIYGTSSFRLITSKFQFISLFVNNSKQGTI